MARKRDLVLPKAEPGAKYAVEWAAVPPFNRTPSHLARRFVQVCRGLLTEALLPGDASTIEYSILRTLEELPNIDQSDLGRVLGIDAVTICQLVDRLEQHKMLTRRVDPKDRRARLLRLTPLGAKRRLDQFPRLHAATRRVLSPLSTSEANTLLELLSRIVEAHKDYAVPGNGRRPPRKQPPSMLSKSK